MPRADASRRRCAIYTRKSSEKGSSRNSIRSRRSAKPARPTFASQQHEGWLLARTRYDDSGFSGGNLGDPRRNACSPISGRAGSISWSCTRSTG